MIAPLVALALAVAAGPDLDEVAHAIEANRLDQAQQMLADASASGLSGRKLERLRADLAFAKGNWTDGETRYAQLAQSDAKDGRSAERAAIASIALGHRRRATTFVDLAIASGNASWRAWNAKGVLCDGNGDWTCADEAFATAAKVAPDTPEIVNNHGWSLLLRGEWTRAVAVLEEASILDTKSARIRNNLELARAAVAGDLPRRRAGETDSDFAARLNDAGVIAERQGNRSRAIAAFSRALQSSGTWYARAANNLAKVQQP